MPAPSLGTQPEDVPYAKTVVGVRNLFEIGAFSLLLQEDV
jgi:hypothetical protein